MRRPTRQTTFNITTLWGACPPFAIGSQKNAGGSVFLNKVALGHAKAFLAQSACAPAPGACGSQGL